MPLTRPEGIPIGQIGKAQSVNPRTEDAGLGSILRQAAGAEFTAAAQNVATGNSMVQFGVAQTEAGLELLKPFKKIRDSREVIMADDIAIRAKLSLRGEVEQLQLSGATPDTWGTEFEKSFSKTSTAALEAAGKLSLAAKEHVYKELQKEQLSLLTGLTSRALSVNIEDQKGALQFKEQYEMTSALSTRDPAVRKAHVNSYKTALDIAEFNRVITPAVKQQKMEFFDKRLREEGAVQIALDKGLPDAFRTVDSMSIPPTEKTEIKNKVEAALKFDRDAAAKTEKMQEKQLKIEQGAQYTTFSGKVLVESNPQTLLTLIHRVPEYVRTGVLHPDDGPKLINDADKRLNELAKSNPEETIDSIFNNISHRIVTNAMSVTYDEINNTRGLSSNSRVQLRDMKLGRESSQHYSKLRTYDNTIELFKSLDVVRKNPFQAILPGSSTGPNLSEEVVRSINTYEAEVMALQSSLGRRLTESDLASLDGRVDAMVKRLKTLTYTTPQTKETLESLTR